MIKKIFTHSAIYGLAPYVPQVASIFILPIITQDLTDIDFGVLGVIMAYTGLVTALSTLGLRVILVNLYYKHRERYKIFWRQIYGFLSIWVILYSIIMAGLVYLIVPPEAAENRWLIVFLQVIPIFFFGPARELCSTLYQIREEPWPIGIRTVIFGLINVSIILYTISYLKLGYMGWFWSSFITNILYQISYWYPLNKIEGISPIFNFKWRYLKQSLKISLPTVPHYYSGYLLDNSDKMIMDFLNVSTGNIGKYNIAYKFGDYTQSMGMAVNKAIGPLMMEQYKNKRDDVARNIVFLVQGLFLLGTATICIWMREIFQLLINNDSLAQMYSLGIIIVMGYNYRPMYIASNQKLFYTENTNLLWKITFVAGISNVGLNLILIPIWGYKVAAITTFISLMYMGYVGFFTKTFKDITPSNVNYHPFIWLSTTIITTIIVYLLKDINILYKINITIISLLLCLIFIYLMNKDIKIDK